MLFVSGFLPFCSSLLLSLTAFKVVCSATLCLTVNLQSRNRWRFVLLCNRLEGGAQRPGLELGGADQRNRQQSGCALSAPEGGAIPGDGPVSTEGGWSLLALRLAIVI